MRNRELVRNKAAEMVCRELRWQIVNYGYLNYEELSPYFEKWMETALKNKWDRPQKQEIREVLKTAKNMP